MAKFALLNATIWGSGYDFTGDTNSVKLQGKGGELDVTTYGSAGSQELIVGLKSVDLDVAGFWQSAATGTAVDPEAWAALSGGLGQVHMISMANTEAQPCFGLQAVKSSYSVGDEVGNAAPFAIKGKGSGGVPMVRGQIAKAKGAVSATGQLGSILTLGAPIAGQSVYAGLHVFASPGTTITVQLQSAALIAFGSPTTRATFTAMTAQGALWLPPVAGPFADAFWRLNVSAITGSFAGVAGWIAVQ
jgi:hypothetical protein